MESLLLNGGDVGDLEEVDTECEQSLRTSIGLAKV